MTSAFLSAGTKSVARAFMAAVANSTWFALLVSSTKLCAIAIFGMVPFDTRRTVSISPGLAVIAARLNFMSSVPTISMTRPLPVAAAAGFSVEGFWVVPAGLVAGAAGFWVAGVCAATGAASRRERITCWYISVPRLGP